MNKVKLLHILKLHSTNHGSHIKQGIIYRTDWCDKCPYFREIKTNKEAHNE